MSKPRKSDMQSIMTLVLALNAATSPAARLRLCALISYRLKRITLKDTAVGKTTHKQKR